MKPLDCLYCGEIAIKCSFPMKYGVCAYCLDHDDDEGPEPDTNDVSNAERSEALASIYKELK